MKTPTEAEFLYSVNQTLQISPDSSQRDFAQATHTSLGMTNAILKRFVQKGWIMMKKITPRKIQYVLTPEGMGKLAERSKSYMETTFAYIHDYTANIEAAVQKAKDNGDTSVVLFGESNISFIIEYACGKYGMHFECVRDQVQYQPLPATYFLISEKVDEQTVPLLVQKGGIPLFDIAQKA